MITKLITPESKLVFDQFKELFPNEYEVIFKYCLHGEYPFGYYHVDILCEICNLKLNKNLLSQIRLANILHCSHYILLDSIVDNHYSGSNSIHYLAHILYGTYSTYTNILINTCPNKLTEFNKLFYNYLSQNTISINQEKKFQTLKCVANTFEEYDSIIGRANAPLFLYQFLCILNNLQINLEFLDGLNKLLFYLQLADDLDDWKDDFQSARWTSFLREIFQTSKDENLDIDELEKIIFFRGYFEKRSITVIKGLNSLRKNFISSNIRCTQLISFIDNQISKLKEYLINITEIKLRNSETYKS